MSDAMISVDEFQALEQKVLRAVEIIRSEREARASAEAEVGNLREQVAQLTAQLQDSQINMELLNEERDSVKTRVERMLRQMDELL
jgi:chromosome segregation ATPase